jgi:4-amino-4-deoxy-L-arabinose transferase-like glycosyltransferase
MATGKRARSGSRRITYPHEVIRQDRPLTRSTGRLAQRAGVVAFVLVALVIVATFLHLDAGNPPGSYRDESNIATNAAAIADSARDEHGRLLPLYFESHSDWKSPPYIYLLAGVFTVTGPDEGAARALSAVLGLTAVVLLGVLGHRLSGDPVVGLATAALAAATPWLFEVSRLVFEVTLVPALVATLLLLLSDAGRIAVWSRRRQAAIGVTIALIAYAYAGGRALAPLLALGLVLFASGGRRRSVVGSLLCCAVALVPMVAFGVARPRALFVRFGQVHDDTGPLDLPWNLLRELNLVKWVLEGDGNLRHHVGPTGSLLLVGVVLAVAGVIVLARGRRWDPFWSFVLVAAVAAGAPAAISDVRLHALRSVALPVVLIVLAIPAIAALRRASNRPLGVVVVLIVGAAAVAQTVAFHRDYAEAGPKRSSAFHAAFPAVLREALQAGDVVVHRSDPDAEGNATWYARLWDVPVRIIEDGERPREGEVVVAVVQRCQACRTIAERDMFIAYVARATAS